MEVLHPHCAGLDIHKDSVVACVRHMAESKVTAEVRAFKTSTQELMDLSDWLSAEGVTHIGMEATGVYWRPIWHILADGEFELVLGQRRSREERAWPQDRCEGCRLVIRSDGAWLDPGQLCSRRANPGDARSAAHA